MYSYLPKTSKNTIEEILICFILQNERKINLKIKKLSIKKIQVFLSSFS
jgi:hypothetical protein